MIYYFEYKFPFTIKTGPHFKLSQSKPTIIGRKPTTNGIEEQIFKPNHGIAINQPQVASHESEHPHLPSCRFDENGFDASNNLNKIEERLVDQFPYYIGKNELGEVKLQQLEDSIHIGKESTIQPTQNVSSVRKAQSRISNQGHAIEGIKMLQQDQLCIQEIRPNLSSINHPKLGFENELRSSNHVISTYPVKTISTPTSFTIQLLSLATYVSRNHCRLDYKDNFLYTIEVLSPNGLFINHDKYHKNHKNFLRSKDIFYFPNLSVVSLVGFIFYELPYVTHLTSEQHFQNLRDFVKSHLKFSTDDAFELIDNGTNFYNEFDRKITVSSADQESACTCPQMVDESTNIFGHNKTHSKISKMEGRAMKEFGIDDPRTPRDLLQETTQSSQGRAHEYYLQNSSDNSSPHIETSFPSRDCSYMKPPDIQDFFLSRDEVFQDILPSNYRSPSSEKSSNHLKSPNITVIHKKRTLSPTQFTISQNSHPEYIEHPDHSYIPQIEPPQASSFQSEESTLINIFQSSSISTHSEIETREQLADHNDLENTHMQISHSPLVDLHHTLPSITYNKDINGAPGTPTHSTCEFSHNKPPSENAYIDYQNVSQSQNASDIDSSDPLGNGLVLDDGLIDILLSKQHKSQNKLSDLADNPCVICSESLLDCTHLGFLEACKHYFCFNCIRKWASVTNLCPLCKKEFFFIKKIPNNITDPNQFSELVNVCRRTISAQPTNDETQIIEEGNGCEICGLDNDWQHLLLCDGCDLAFHTSCLVPPLQTIPLGNWYCPNCEAEFRRTRNSRYASKKTLSDLEQWIYMPPTHQNVPNTHTNSQARQTKQPMTPLHPQRHSDFENREHISNRFPPSNQRYRNSNRGRPPKFQANRASKLDHKKQRTKRPLTRSPSPASPSNPHARAQILIRRKLIRERYSSGNEDIFETPFEHYCTNSHQANTNTSNSASTQSKQEASSTTCLRNSLFTSQSQVIESSDDEDTFANTSIMTPPSRYQISSIRSKLKSRHLRLRNYALSSSSEDENAS